MRRAGRRPCCRPRRCRRCRHGSTWRGSGVSATSSGVRSGIRWRRTCTRRSTTSARSSTARMSISSWSSSRYLAIRKSTCALRYIYPGPFRSVHTQTGPLHAWFLVGQCAILLCSQNAISLYSLDLTQFSITNDEQALKNTMVLALQRGHMWFLLE